MIKLRRFDERNNVILVYKDYPFNEASQAINTRLLAEEFGIPPALAAAALDLLPFTWRFP